jgi:hypothetical protein
MNIQAALVHAILEHHKDYAWTVQGFGFLRTKLADVGRIHVWDTRLRTPTMLSDIHTHPWPLKSTIIIGELINQRFHVGKPGKGGLPYLSSKIKCGEGGGIEGAIEAVSLTPCSTEFYSTGDTYSQMENEIHRSIVIDGTVTLMERPAGMSDATTYWPAGLNWVSAEPRPATEWEVTQAVSLALSRWSA